MSKFMRVPGYLKGPAAALGLAAFLAMPAGEAGAALMPCPASFIEDGTARVHDGTASRNTAASACQWDSATDQSDPAKIKTINSSGFFGFNDWSELNSALTQTDQGEGLSGTWSISGADWENFTYAIVFKSGRGTSLIAFLLNGLFDEGEYLTPFTSLAFTDLKPGQQKGVSHYTIVQRDGGRPDPAPPPSEVTEPSVLGLIGLSLLGLGLAACNRRRRLIVLSPALPHPSSSRS